MPALHEIVESSELDLPAAYEQVGTPAVAPLNDADFELPDQAAVLPDELPNEAQPIELDFPHLHPLMEAVRSKGGAGIWEIAAAYRPILLRSVNSMLFFYGGALGVTAEDVVSEATLRLARKFMEPHPDGSPYYSPRIALFVGAAQRIIKDVAKSSDSRRTSLLLDDPLWSDESALQAPEAGPEERALKRADREAAQAAMADLIEQLSPAQQNVARALLRLHWGGRSAQGNGTLGLVAAELGIKEGVVRAHVGRIRKRARVLNTRGLLQLPPSFLDIED